MIPINKKLIDYFEDVDLNVGEALLFCFAVEYQQYELLNLLIEKELITLENEMFFRINLTTMDENGNIILKYSLFNFDTDEQFQTYIDELKRTGLMINGMSYNQQEYAILTTDEETQKQFSKFVLSHPDFSLEKLVKITENYYSQVTKAKKLVNFLATDAITMYK